MNEENKEPEEIRIAAAGNVEYPALLVILQKGYELEIVTYEEDDTLCDFQAIKDNHTFFASRFIELLGLIALWEHRGDKWKLTDDEFIVVKDAIEKAEIKAGLV